MKGKKNSYDVWQLVDRRVYQDLGASQKKNQIISDIDKTYLETAFESWVKMARIAFEDASDKRSVTGAPQLLQALRWGQPGTALSLAEKDEYPRPLHFVSSSPPQLRNVLEEKLSMDGLDWSSDTFKNQAYNIRKRRFSLLKQQVAYKTAALIQLIGNQKPGTFWYLIGDNAESDPFIYLGIKLLIEGKIGKEGFARYLELADVEQELTDSLWNHGTEIPSGYVKGIFIRNIQNHRFYGESPLTDPVTLFDSYLDASLVFYLLNMLQPACLEGIIRVFHNLYGVSPEEICTKLKSAIAGAETEEQSETLKIILHNFSQKTATKIPEQNSYNIKKSNQTFWDQMTEDQILTHAKSWMNKIRLNKNQQNSL